MWDQPTRGELATSQLVGQLAWLGVAPVVELVGLSLPERAQRRAGELDPSIPVINAVISVSRPNSVRNHGAPAATNGRSLRRSP